MEKSKVEFVYKNISSLNKISIVNKKIFRILPYICVPSLAIGGIAVFLKEMLPIKGVLPNYIRLVCLVIFFLTFLMWLVSFFFEYIFLFLWKCPVCKGKFPWYKTTLGYLGEEGGSLVNKEVKDICDRKNKKISLIQYENSNLINSCHTSSTAEKNPLTEIQEGELYLCLEHRTVRVRERIINLTSKEFDILALLIANPKRVFTYELITDLVWKEDCDFYSRKAIHNHISKLRKKLRFEPDLPNYIESVAGIGYKFEHL